MPDNGSQIELTIRRLPEGGFVVLSNVELRYASKDIDDCLQYMRGQINPIVLQQRILQSTEYLDDNCKVSAQQQTHNGNKHFDVAWGKLNGSS